MKRYKGISGIIFDFDGVLIETDVCHYKAWKVIADQLHIPFDEDVNQLLRGVSREESLEIILKSAGVKITPEEKKRLLEQKNKLYFEFVCNMDHTKAREKIHYITNELYKRGIKSAIGSASKNARKILEKMNATQYFDGIIDGNDITKGKPDKEVFVKASQQIKVDSENCLVVEDSASGLEAAFRAGMRSVCIKKAEKMEMEVEYANDVLEVLDMVESESEAEAGAGAFQPDRKDSVKLLSIDRSLAEEEQLDCYQNLKMLLLRNQGLNTDFMFTGWPWEFQVVTSTDTELKISDVECLDKEKFLAYYGIDYNETEVKGQQDILNQIKKKIDEGCPVIVSYDEFYSFYHYEHIYQKEHGDHAILILGYDDEKEEVTFYSAIPEYYGVMRYSSLVEGILALDNPLLIQMTRCDSAQCVEEQELWMNYVNEALEIRDKYYMSQTKELKEGDYLYAPQIREVLEQLKEHSNEEICRRLNVFLEGTWMWHIDRKAKLSREAIMRSELLKEQRTFVQEYFDEVITKWVLASRLMYKIMLTGSLKRYDEVINLTKEIEGCDVRYFNMLERIIKK